MSTSTSASTSTSPTSTSSGSSTSPTSTSSGSSHAPSIASVIYMAHAMDLMERKIEGLMVKLAEHEAQIKELDLKLNRRMSRR